MAATTPSYAGIMQLSKEFTISIVRARKALMAAKIMDCDGAPVKSEYADQRLHSGDKVWYAWDKKIAVKAFLKAGLKKPTALELYSYVQNKHQATSRLNDAFAKIGEASKLELAYEKDPEAFKEAYGVYYGARVGENNAIGGRFSVFFLSNKNQCADFIDRLHRVIDDYESTCKSICKTKKQIAEVEFYAAAIRRVADWIQLQFFR